MQPCLTNTKYANVLINTCAKKATSQEYLEQKPPQDSLLFFSAYNEQYMKLLLKEGRKDREKGKQQVPSMATYTSSHLLLLIQNSPLYTKIYLYTVQQTIPCTHIAIRAAFSAFLQVSFSFQTLQFLLFSKYQQRWIWNSNVSGIHHASLQASKV